MPERNPDSVNFSPFETEDVRENLTLFLNSPFVLAQAEALNRQPEIAEAVGVVDRITLLYRRVLWREPAAEERALAEEFLGPSPDSERWARFAQVLLLSNEFSHCD